MGGFSGRICLSRCNNCTNHSFRKDDFSQNAEVDIERNNEIEQSNEQSQEVCTNEAEVSVSDDDVIGIGGENEAEVEQSNDCIVVQNQEAENNAAILDLSENTFDITEGLCLSFLPLAVDCQVANILPDFP